MLDNSDQVAQTVQLESLQQSYTADPTDKDTALALAQQYSDRGWYNQAADIYQPLLKKYDNDIVLLLDYGNLCFCRQNFEEALSIFRKITVLKPGRIEGWNNLGIVQLKLGRTDDARDSFARVLESEPDNPGALLNMGNYYDAKQDHDRARDYFRHVVRVRADFADAWFNLGNAELNCSDLPAAVEAYKRALRAQREFPAASKNLGVAYERMARYSDALQAYQAALLLNRADAGLYVNCANIYLAQRDYNEAKKHYSMAVKLAPQELPGWLGLRHLALQRGDIITYVKSTEAIISRLDQIAIAESIDILHDLRHYDHANQLINLADRLKKTGDEIDAQRLLYYARTKAFPGRIAAILKRLKELPAPPDIIKKALATYFCTTKEFETALRYADAITTPTTATAILLWKALIGCGRYTAAEPLIAAFLAEHNDCHEGHYLRAVIAVHTGNNKQALTHLFDAIENGFTGFDALDQEPALKKLYADIVKNKIPSPQPAAPDDDSPQNDGTRGFVPEDVHST